MFLEVKAPLSERLLFEAVKCDGWMNDVMERGMESRLLLVQHMMDTDEDGQEKTVPQHVLHPVHEPSLVCLPPVSFQHNWEKTPSIKRLLYSFYHF